MKHLQCIITLKVLVVFLILPLLERRYCHRQTCLGSIWKGHSIDRLVTSAPVEFDSLPRSYSTPRSLASLPTVQIVALRRYSKNNRFWNRLRPSRNTKMRISNKVTPRISTRLQRQLSGSKRITYFVALDKVGDLGFRGHGS